MIKNKISLTPLSILLFALSTLVFTSLACAQKSNKKSAAKPKTKVQNEITITIAGATTKFTNGINAVIIGGKFMGITNEDGQAKVGDSEKLSSKAGSAKTGARIIFNLNGKTMADTGESCSISITFFDGKTIKGTFAAELGPDQQSSKDRVVAVGTFQTNDILNL